MKFLRDLQALLHEFLEDASDGLTAVERDVRGIVRKAAAGPRRVLRRARRSEQAAVNRVATAERKVIRKEQRAVAAGVGRVRQLVTAFTGLIGQIAHDIGHGVAWVANLPVRGARAAGQSIGKATKALTRPFHRASRADVEPLPKPAAEPLKPTNLEAPEAVTITSDRQSHKEIILLIVAAAVLIGGALIWLASTGGLAPLTGGKPMSVGGFDPKPWLAVASPERVLKWLSNLSPQHLMLVFGGGAMLLAGTFFWVQMVRDAFRRDFSTAKEKTQWRLVTSLLFIPGAAVYFFKIYNQWTLRQFAGHHVVSIMVTSMALLVSTSTYGTLWYFNKQAEAQAPDTGAYRVPNLDLDPISRSSLLSRTKYGAPLVPVPGGRVDPFAPIPGELAPTPLPTPSPSPSPTPAP